jgi:hypothetical protein
MPCTTENSIPRYSIAIAFVCRRLCRKLARPGLSTAPRPLRGMGSRRGPCRAHSDAQPANKTIRWIELFLDSVADDQQGILGPCWAGLSLALAYRRGLSIKQANALQAASIRLQSVAGTSAAWRSWP